MNRSLKTKQKYYWFGIHLRICFSKLTSHLLPSCEPSGTEFHFGFHDSSQQNSTQYHQCRSGERASWLSGQLKPVSDHCFWEPQARPQR